MNKRLNLLNVNFKDVSFFSLIFVFVSLIYARDLLNINIPSSFFVILSVAIFSISNISMMLAFLAFLIPFTTGIPGSFITLAALVIYIVKVKEINVNSGLVAIWIIAIIEVVNMFGWNNSLTLFFRVIIFLVFITLVLTNPNEKYDYFKIVKYYLYGYTIACIDIILQTLKEFNITQFITSGIRFGRTLNYVDTDIEGKLVSPNVNSLGIYSLMVITIVIVLIFLNKRNYKFLPFLLFASVVGFLTYSRTFVLSTGIALILFSFFSGLTKKRIINNIVLISFLLIFALLFMAKFPTASDFMSSRFQVEDISSGRLDISSYYTEYLLTHPKAMIMGVGLQDYKTKTGYSMSAHNGTQEILIAWGIIGLICIIILFLRNYKNSTRNIKVDLVTIVPAIAFLVSLQASRLFSAGYLIIMLIPIYCIIRLRNERVE